MKDALPANDSPAGLDSVPQRTVNTLFRREAIEARRASWLGPVVLVPRHLHRAFAAVALATAIGILLLFAFGAYTRTTRVTGWLVPAEGMVRVFTPQPGIVSALYVREGQQVRKGERLLALSSEVQSSALGATQSEIARRLHERRRSLQQQRDEHARLVAQQERNLGERIRTLGREQQQLDQAIALQRSRVGIAAQDVKRQRALRKQGFVSDAGLQQAQAAQIEQAGRLATLERDRSTKARERLALEAELEELPFKAQAENAALEREVGELEQELATTEARRELVLVAPHDGVVTALLAEAGGQALTSSPLLSIVPPGAKLQGHLYSPSRAVGFVQPGQRVWLRYQPFPFQKFGHQEAVVTSVSRSPLSPAELPPQLSGLLAGSKDPVYRVTVELRSQTIRAYGADIALQPGTQLDADIALETRRLYEWVLEPLYTLSGTWQS